MRTASVFQGTKTGKVVIPPSSVLNLFSSTAPKCLNAGYNAPFRKNYSPVNANSYDTERRIEINFSPTVSKGDLCWQTSQDGGSINKLMNHMPVAMRKPKRSSLLLSFPAASCWLFVNLKASFYFTPTVMSSSSKQTSRFRYANRWTSITLACDLDKLYR